MKRSIRVKMDFVVDVDDNGLGLPRPLRLGEAIAQAAKAVVPGCTYLHPGGKISIGLVRASNNRFARAPKRAR